MFQPRVRRNTFVHARAHTHTGTYESSDKVHMCLYTCMQVRASTEIAPGLSGLSILNNSLAGPRKYTARLLVCGSTFLKGPCRILGAGTVSCLQCLYLTYPERNDDDYNPTMEESPTPSSSSTSPLQPRTRVLPRLLKMHN